MDSMTNISMFTCTFGKVLTVFSIDKSIDKRKHDLKMIVLFEVDRIIGTRMLSIQVWTTFRGNKVEE